MLFNFVILFGPLLIMNLSQIQAFEPGDAQWGVKLDDVRGQVEAKEEVRRVVSIWQSGEQFERAGGKRERGLLFLGAPGTGKTMLAKALATGFNSPFVSIPGSGFAATFIGIDAIVVRIVARRAKKLARKWGGQCIVFIDEIDAVGMRRQALGSGRRPGWLRRRLTARLRPRRALLRAVGRAQPLRRPDPRDARLARAAVRTARAPRTFGINAYQAAMMRIFNFMFPGGMGGMGGGLALNQLLVVMDGIDNPPFFKKFFTNKRNTLLDGIYIVPRRIRGKSLRLPAAKPRKEQIYFIGATNVPIERLDPALTRPGRMGRHVWFRTPTKQDRLDILDLYIGKVSHDADLDTPERRDEIARDHERLLAGDDRAGDVDGADDRAPLRAASVRLGRARRGDDHARERHRPSASSTSRRRAGDGDPRGGSRDRRSRLPDGPESTRLSIRMRGGSLGHHQALREGGALQPLPELSCSPTSCGVSARWPPSASSTTRTRSVSAATSLSATAQAASMVGSAGRWARSRSTSSRARARRRSRPASGSSTASSRSVCRS